MIKNQLDFPLLEEFKKRFLVTEETIFAYNGNIYSDKYLPNDIIVHEEEHLRQQEEYGLNEWVDGYLNDDKFRLKMEIKAYRKQIDYIKDRNQKHLTRLKCSEALSSGLYGYVLTPSEAYERLK